MSESPEKPIYWLGDAKRRLRGFPAEVQDEVGFALYQAQVGGRHPASKHMSELNAVEVISDFDGDTFRSVYTTRFKNVIFVLHCFQKKSKTGKATPKPDLDLIRKRLRDAEKIYKTTIEK